MFINTVSRVEPRQQRASAATTADRKLNAINQALTLQSGGKFDVARSSVICRNDFHITLTLIMSRRALLSAFGWLLLVASVGAVAASLFYESSVRKALEGAAIPAGVLLALAGHLFTQAKSFADADEKRSLFNLEGFKMAFEHAHGLLSDGNNDRAKWIEAARSLAHGEALAKEVTVDEHKRVLELERLKYRSSFHQVLAGRNAMFFYGVPDLYPTLDEAAVASSKRPERGGRTVVAGAYDLNEASIRAVWLAARWPKDYEDPRGERFQEKELGQVTMFFPEIHRFIEHKKAWSSVGGKLFARGENERY